MKSSIQIIFSAVLLMVISCQNGSTDSKGVSDSELIQAIIDADKINYLEYYKRCYVLIKKGGIIILDNMLWSGSVVIPNDEDAHALRKTGDFIHEDTRITNMLLPIRDGLMVCIKNEE